MEKNTFLQLLDRYINGSASEAEKKLVEEYYGQLVKDGMVEMDEANTDERKKNVLNSILATVHDQPVITSQKSGRTLLYITRIAAAVALIILSTFLYKLVTNPGPSAIKPEAGIKEYANPLLPGSDKAILTLADGSNIALDSNGNRTFEQQGSSIVTQNGGHLKYSSAQNVNRSAYNILTTPRGGQYHLTLEDGTKVWLNATSSIRYPVNFSGANRTVELEGEAYFEVAQDKRKPFIVKVNEMSVEVLGTHFNIMAYADEHSVSTTLLEGSVKVIGNGSSRVLKPGQQSMYNADALYIEPADTEKVMAWKNGMFLFKGDDIKTIMRQIGRWYDVEVSFAGNISSKLYRGSISKYVTAPEVLRILELAGIQFKIDGKKITVL